MPVVASVDYDTKRIYLSAETVGASVDTLDVYREVRALRRTTEAHRKYRPMIIAGGNITKITGVSSTPSYVQLLYGCRIVPFNTSHSLKIIRDTFTDDGLAGRDCFDRTPLSPTVAVDIDVDFPEIENRFISGGGALSPAETALLTQAANLSVVLESGFTAAQLIRLQAAVLLGRSSGHPNAPVFRDVNDTTDRVSGTVDVNGNRTSITLSP